MMWEFLTEIFGVIPVSFVQQEAFMIPVWQMLFFMLIISFCIFYRRFQMGLMITFVFCFFWGFIVNRDLFISSMQGEYTVSWTFILYILAGSFLVIVPLISFLKS